MYALNIAGKWRITLCKVRSSEWSDTEVVCYRAENFTTVLASLSRVKDSVPVKVELIGLYYYQLFFDLESDQTELPFDLSVFLTCLY